MNTEQVWQLALPLIVAVAAYVRAELAHHAAATAAAAPAPAAPAPAPAAPAPAPALAAYDDIGPAALRDAPSADLWAELEHRGWSIASQPFPPPPAAAAWPPLPRLVGQAGGADPGAGAPGAG